MTDHDTIENKFRTEKKMWSGKVFIWMTEAIVVIGGLPAICFFFLGLGNGLVLMIGKNTYTTCVATTADVLIVSDHV
jgi:hypothetical protein